MPPLDEGMIRRFYRDVGSRVRTARTGANKTQDELAEHVGVARTSISNLEAGRQRIPLHLFIQIAEGLEVSPTELLPSRSIYAQAGDFYNIDEQLAEASDSRDFVSGAIAKLLAESQDGGRE